MSGLAVVVLIFIMLAAGLGAVAYFTYQRKLRRAKAIERGLKMVPILIHLPPPSSDTQAGNRDVREVMREKTAQAEVLYNLIAGTATEGFKSAFYGQRHMALELIAIDGIVHFYAAVPVALVSVAKQAIQTAYPGARVEETEDYNIFNQEGRLAATLGGEMVLRQESAYPIATYAKLERDPMEAILTTISALDKKDGVAVQVMMRPASRSWSNRSKKLADGKRKGRHQSLGFSAMDLAKAVVKSPDQVREEERARMGGGPNISNLELAEIESIEEKTKHPGFEVLIRVIVSTESVARSQQLLRDISTAFALFETPGLNGFKFLPALDVQGLVTAFIFRFFPPELKSNVLNSVELATLFHLPDSQFTPARSIAREQSKQVDGPVQLPTQGLIFGHNEFRGVKKEIRLSPEDRRRHTYILGQTGTGKSTMLENLAAQDMLSGNGFAFIDPHGDSAEKLLALVPKSRAEDVIYFNPADTEYPLGLNLFEFSDPSQKDFLVQETINMLYKLYDPGHTGIIGPRYEHWYRNAALTLMSDPDGATFIEIPKVFTDTDYLKLKFKHLKDPTVIDFWTKEMGQTSEYHKSEMLGWFVSKFGAFQNNEMMRNIIGQTKSAFNMREVMDQKKILIVNLSKGRIGELNSQLLGMIFVIKFQAAAMSRADVPESERPDFCLYVDEFQNFSTDSFASILSEARKYRLNLTVANQFIGQLSDEIRDAVFGNIGTIVAHRMGPEDAEFMVKQFAPVFDSSDLVNIPNYNAAMRLMIGGLPSQPFTLRDSAPIGQPNLELGLAIKQLSAAKFGNVKSQVEADIIDRFNAKPAPVVPAVGAGVAPATVQDAGTAAATAPVAAAGAIPAAASAPASAMMVQPAPVVPAVPAVAAVVPQPAPVVPPTFAQQVPAQPVYAPPAEPTVVAPAAPVLIQPAQVAAPGFDTHPVPHQHQAQQFASPAAQLSATNSAVMPDPAPVVATPAPVVNTAGAVMAPVAPIIPEDGQDDAATMAMEGGFGDLDASFGAPAVAAPASVPATSGLAVTPPPIGAPPVDLSAIPPIGAPPVDTISAPVSQPATPELAIAPPPIGAPPVELPTQVAMPTSTSASAPVVASIDTVTAPVPPAPAPREPVMAMTPRQSAPVPIAASATLSLADITGGRPPAPRVVAMPASAPAPAPVSAPVVSAAVPLGYGEPLASDPYANIDVLGDLTPPGQPASVAPAPLTGLAATPLLAGSPLPNDPYAAIDVLGSAPAPVTASAPTLAPAPALLPTQTVAPAPAPAPVPMAAPAPVPVQTPAPVAVPPVAAPVLAPAAVAIPTPAPVLAAPAPAAAVSAPAPVPVLPASLPVPVPVAVAPATVEPPVVPAPVVPAPVATPSIPAPVVVQAPSPVPQPPAVQAPSPIPEPPLPAVGEFAPAPVAAPPQPESSTHWATAVHPEYPVSSSSDEGLPPILASPIPAALPAQAPIAPAPVSAPAPVISLQPASVESQNLSQLLPDEPLIHFVDPSAEEVMKRPDVPDTITPENDEELLLNGLPEGVKILKPEDVAQPVVPTPPIPAPTTPVPVAAAPAAPAAPVVETAPVLSQPVPLANMAKTPPPIGAAPVDIGAVAVPVALPEPEPLKSKPPVRQPIPEPNATLAAALFTVPAPAPQLDAVDAADTLKAVGDKTSVAKAEAAPVAPVKPAVASQASNQAPQAKEPAPVAPPVASAPQKPQSAPTPEAQIEKAEQEIDDLLSVSIIHTDTSTTHRRLPEPVEYVRQEPGIPMEMNAPRPMPSPSTPPLSAEHHGLKVIQPLEPIVPPKERFAKELAELTQAEQASSAQQQDQGRKGKPKPQPAPKPQPLPAPPSAPVAASPAPVQQVAVAAAPAAAPTAAAPVAPIIKHEGVALEQPPQPVAAIPRPVFEEEEGLPQAESLAADDVAKARAERQAKEVMANATPIPDAPVVTNSVPTAPAPAPAPAPAKPEPQKEQKEQKQTAPEPAKIIKHKPKPPPREEKPAEHVESAEEAEHNKPTEAEKEQGALTGKLILPTAAKPAPAPVQPKVEKPKKLAPGEVFVDEHGNVVIGE